MSMPIRSTGPDGVIILVEGLVEVVEEVEKEEEVVLKLVEVGEVAFTAVVVVEVVTATTFEIVLAPLNPPPQLQHASFAATPLGGV